MVLGELLIGVGYFQDSPFAHPSSQQANALRHATVAESCGQYHAGVPGHVGNIEL
jgi:hypothetical protein